MTPRGGIWPSVALLCLAGLAGLAGQGCTRSFILEEDGAARRRDGGADAGDAGPDALPDGRIPLPDGKCELSSQVDLLFVIDNSNSMTEEQASLAAELPFFIDLLTNPPDEDGDGAADYPPIDDIHVGVVTTDMGTGGFVVPTCASPNFGDDGVLRTTGNTASARCRATTPPFLSFTNGDDLTEFSDEMACKTVAGTGGCGFEQPLEAALKAVTPSTSPIEFFMGTAGHADGANRGFFREGAMLGVIFVTDEEDCSVRDPEVLNPGSSVYSGDLNLRCMNYPDAVHPVERYIEGFRMLRPERPDLFTFAVVAAMPADFGPPGGLTDPADMRRLLDDERMVERVDPDEPSRLVPSCNVPGRGLGFPPRRLVEVAAAFPEQSVVTSLCQESFTLPIQLIGRTIGRRACASYVLD